MKRVIASILVVLVFLVLVPYVFSLTAKQQPGQKIERFTGRVASISTPDMKMVVESMKASMTFEIGGARLNGYKTVNNIKEGDRVTVQYVMHQGKATARTITKNKSYLGNGPLGPVMALHDAR